MVPQRTEPEIKFIYPKELRPKTEDLLRELARLCKDDRRIFPILARGKSIDRINRIELVELSRIGGEEGKGGSKVFMLQIKGTLVDGKEVESVSLLIKIAEENREVADSLIDEENNYRKIAEYFEEKSLAKPFDTYDGKDLGAHDDTCILIAESLGDPSHALELRDLLEEEKWDEAEKCLHSVYKIVNEAHRVYRQKLGSTDNEIDKNFPYAEKYEQYLRLNKGWYDKVKRALGEGEKIDLFGKTRRNPMSTLEKVLTERDRFTSAAKVGPVHGDLHPRNVLTTELHEALLIDFGWADASFHYIIDCVLMELSIKHFYLPWSVNRIELIHWEDDLTNQMDLTFEPNDRVLRGATKLIQIVRTAAKSYITGTTEYIVTLEYLLPLFLVAMGYFSFEKDIRNHEHLLYSCALLAEKINGLFDG